MSYWLWYPGDFEIHQGMIQSFSREERGMGWPAYWYMDDCYCNVMFSNEYELKTSTEFTVYAKGTGFVSVDGHKSQLSQSIRCPIGKHKIEVQVGNTQGLPCIYIEGEVIKSDPTWRVGNFIQTEPAGYSDRYTLLSQDPNQMYFAKQAILAQKVTPSKKGVLYDFGQVVNGQIQVDLLNPLIQSVTLCYGESATEASDVEMCYYKQEQVTPESEIRKRAFRYIYIPDINESDVELIAYHEFYPRNHKATFKTDNHIMNEIWKTSQTTYDLCSDWFFIDGVKRDRWIWAGDAYQTNFINQYSNFDEEVDKRTIIALRGHDGIQQHINTIVDYSILWIISIYNHYQMTGDVDFLKFIFKRMQGMIDYLRKQTDELGFIYGRENDWVFIDWSEIDKEGITAAAQLLLVRAYQAFIECGKAIGADVSNYKGLPESLLDQTIKHFWDDDLGCFIDSYVSGKRHVSRHPNIIAIIYGLVSKDKQKSILENVLLNDQIPEITTPYFKFFEQDALCKLGQFQDVYKIIESYWGGMLEQGATTFWEEYNPDDVGVEHYSMYGDKYGKSLCHAWGSSPIYLLGRYFIGLKSTEVGYRKFEIEPHLEMFNEVNCVLPIKGGQVEINKSGGKIKITASRDGGMVKYKGKDYQILKNKMVTLG